MNSNPYICGSSNNLFNNNNMNSNPFIYGSSNNLFNNNLNMNRNYNNNYNNNQYFGNNNNSFNNMSNMNMNNSMGMNNLSMGSRGMNNMMMGSMNPMMNINRNMNSMMNNLEMHKNQKMHERMLGYKMGKLNTSSAPSNKNETLSENKWMDFNKDEYMKNSIQKNLEKSKEDEKLKEDDKLENVIFSPKELVLTQDIFDGFWGLNPQTKSLIKKEKELYEKIEKLMKEKNIEKEEIIITLFVIYYLNNDTSLNKIEYSLIIKKGIKYLENNGINYEEISGAIQK
jgi:hypothetical protein